ncbi:Trypsin-2 [Basidiobolus ranarum]|uniref:Trypsin-2 n=1 Tax=Basidiobolus ranarum TaxID=34480 RepID=A0ABR2WYS0_9FUNG
MLIFVVDLLMFATIALGILNGRKGSPGELFFSARMKEPSICSGVRIHEKWIITLASCVIEEGLALPNRTDAKILVEGNSFIPLRIIVHSDYTEDFDSTICEPNCPATDFALIEIQSNSNITFPAIKIGDHQVLEKGSSLRVASWGVKSNKKDTTVTTVPLWNSGVIGDIYYSLEYAFTDVVVVRVDQEQPLCEDDFGATLFRNENNTVVVYGLFLDLVGWTEQYCFDKAQAYQFSSLYSAKSFIENTTNLTGLFLPSSRGLEPVNIADIHRSNSYLFLIIMLLNILWLA